MNDKDVTNRVAVQGMNTDEHRLKCEKYDCHVFSNTHWDREWIKPFQVYRMLLVDYIDQLLDLFDGDPDFKHFHLDSQSLPLEDYLEIRPENRDRLKALVTSGKLLVGPWYDLPDMNMLNGECLIRNLLRGHKLSKGLGKVMKVGYTPTSTGQISQLPQIYHGFGIDTAFFYRGINSDVARTEYIWEAPDGSRVLGVRGPLPSPRANFWMHLLLGAVYGMAPDRPETWRYSPEQGGLPFRMAEDGESGYELLNPALPYHSDALARGVDNLVGQFEGQTLTGILPVFNGHDHNPPYPETPRVIADANRLRDDVVFKHSSLPKYIDAVKRALETGGQELGVLKGEMRYTNQTDTVGGGLLCPGALTTRIYLKQENCRMENLLLRQAEPAAVMASMLGKAYPRPFMDMAWRFMLLNHSHDCMMGCSVDKVHADMMFRYSEVAAIGKEVVRRSLAETVKHIDTSSYAREDVLLAAFNLQPAMRSEVVKVAVDLPPETEAEAISVTDSQGRQIPVQMAGSRDMGCHLKGDGFLKEVQARRMEAYLHLENLPATGYRVLHVSSAGKADAGSLVESETSMANRYLHVAINPNGTLTVTCRETGRKYENLNWFRDQGEVGNAWNSQPPENNRVVDSLDAVAQIRLIEEGPLKASFETTIVMELPKCAVSEFTARSEETTPVKIVSVISLCRGSKRVDVETAIDNTAEDHKLRAMFPTGLSTGVTHAAMPFDVVERNIALSEGSAEWFEPAYPYHPNQGFVDLSDGENGLAIINEALLEYEVPDEESRTIALTVLKSTWQHGSVPGKGRWPDRGIQCQGMQTCRYAIYPHVGDWKQGEVYDQLNAYRFPVKVAQCGANKGHLPLEQSFLDVSPAQIQVSAVKASEEGEGIILRLFNPGSQSIKATVTVKDGLKQVCLLDLEENKMDELECIDNRVELPIAHHKIVTLRLQQGG